MNIEIVTKLSDHLKHKLKEADEIWIAVALINADGLQYITTKLKSTCKQNYIIGIDLPTDPKALELLNKLQYQTDLKVGIYSEKNNFHPKLYLISKKGNFCAFIGSANCTNGGLSNNEELTTFIEDNAIGNQLVAWFEKEKSRSKPLTTQFVTEYQKKHQDRLDAKKEEEKLAKKGKDILNLEYNVSLKEKTEFIKMLKKYRRDSQYSTIVAERKKNVKTLRQDLDYPNFQNIDIDSYFKEWELGHLIPISKPAIKRNIPRLKKLLKYLTDETIDIAIRYQNALHGDLKVEGVAKAFVSKVLTIHKPELYFVKNGKIEKALKKYGLAFPRGLNEGEKYRTMCHFLQQICADTDFKDLTVLDYYLYLEGNND